MHLQTTPVFLQNYDSGKFITINRGGTRSSKTYSIAQLMVLWLTTGVYSSKRPPIMKGVWTTARRFSSSLDPSVIRDFEEVLEMHGIKTRHDKTRKTYSYGPRMVEFIGADDEQKIRGPKRDILYCNEANELDFKTQFFQLMIRTSDKIFIDFNPSDDGIWINTELEQKRLPTRGDVDVIVSSFKDNTFLPQRMVEEIEALQIDDPEQYKVYGLGEYGNIIGVIFQNWKVVADLPMDDKGQPTAKLLGYGMDFGFTHDPTTLLGLYQQDGELWVDELIWAPRLTNPDICTRMRELGIKREEIIADSAEPKSIHEIYVQGFNIKGAVKGADSVRNGIDVLKRYKINVTARSLNLIKEFRTYKWATNRSNEQQPEPEDKNNHGIDALRYIATAKLSKSHSGQYHIH